MTATSSVADHFPWLTDQPIGAQPIRYTLPDAAEQPVYIVAPDGQANHQGTVASPLSLEQALAIAPDRATIVLRGGTYRTGYRHDRHHPINQTSISSAITIQPYLDETPVLKGSLTVNDWTATDRVWFTRWPYHFSPSKDTIEEATTANPMAAYNDGVWIDGAALTQVESRDRLAPGKFYLETATNTLYIGSDPSGKTVEVTAFSTGLRSDRLQQGGLTIRGLTFMHYATNAVFLDAPQIVLEHNTFAQNRRSGFFIGTIGARRMQNAGDAVVRHNTFSENGTSGGSTVRGDRLLFEYNWVKANNTKQADYSAGGVKFVRTDGGIVRHNWFDHNRGISLWFDGGSTNATIVDNWIEGEEAIGIFWEISDRSIIAGNWLIHNGEGIRISGATHAQIYNNTFSDNGAITIRASDRDRRGQAGPGYIADTVIKNNIFAISDSRAERILSFKTAICQQPLVTALDYNAYYRSRRTQPQPLIEWEKYPYDDQCPQQQGKLYRSLAEFQTAIGFEAHGFEQTGSPNPFFRAATDYRLTPDSPALAAGEPLPPAIAEALGWPTGVAVNLGAWQSR